MQSKSIRPCPFRTLIIVQLDASIPEQEHLQTSVGTLPHASFCTGDTKKGHLSQFRPSSWVSKAVAPKRLGSADLQICTPSFGKNQGDFGTARKPQVDFGVARRWSEVYFPQHFLRSLVSSYVECFTLNVFLVVSLF